MSVVKFWASSSCKEERLVLLINQIDGP